MQELTIQELFNAFLFDELFRGDGISTERVLSTLDEVGDEIAAVCSHAVAREDNVRMPGEEFFADDTDKGGGFGRVAPATVQYVLVLETEVPSEGDALSAEFQFIDRQIETVPGNKEGVEF